MTSRLDNPPHCKHKLVFRSKNYSTTPRSLWRNKYSSAITSRVNEARVLSLQMIFFMCVNTGTQKQKCLCESVCEKETIFFFASGSAAFPIAVPPVTERVFVCQGAGSSHPGGLSPIMTAPLQSLLSWDRQGSKAFPQDATKEQAWVFSSLCLKIMHCVFLPYI